ncbi:MAG: PD-(D/E)XK nuclease family transposase [Synergistaceae bacterium]|nr:PD-(D/E)XK nuclease family transposase [Synergistaceae bacterium]
MCKMNPRVDFVFKKLFGTEESKDILIDLINSIVSEKDTVVDIELRNPYNEKQFLEDKRSVLDIKARSEEGKWYDIEMQVLPEDWFAKRSLYYWSRLYSEQLQEGKHYRDLTKTICINILNFSQLYDEPLYHNVYKVRNVVSNSELLDEFELHFIELRKYDESLADSLKTALDRWVNFLKLAGVYDSETMPEELKASPPVRKAMNLLERLSATKEERAIYDDRLKWIRDVESSLETMERRGRELGRAEGIEIGREQGLEQAKKENARRMLRKGMSIADVSEYADLPEDAVRLLASEFQD